MKLALRGDALVNWWTIEDKDHGCFGDADIEGRDHEMTSIADAIERGGSVRYKRCAVAVRVDGVELWSPRNSTRRELVPLSVARALAASIRRCLRPTAKESR